MDRRHTGVQLDSVGLRASTVRIPVCMHGCEQASRRPPLQRKFGFFLAKTLPPTPTLMVASRRLRLFWFGLCVWMCGVVVVGIALESLFWGAVWLCEERSRVWSHSVVEHLLCEVMCLGVRDGAAETLLTGVKVVPETMYLGKSSIGGDIAHIGDWCVFSCVYYIIRFIGISSSTTRRSIEEESRSIVALRT